MAQGVTPAPIKKLNVINPLDHLRLLGWFFMSPKTLHNYRRQVGKHAVQKIGAWTTSTLLWLPLATVILSIQLGILPVLDKELPLILILMGLLSGWLITGALGAGEPQLEEGWRASFGELINAAIVVVFGFAFGIAFGMAFITGLDIADIVSFGPEFGQTNIILLTLFFGMTFGIGFIVADQIAFGGIFIVAPVLAFMIAFVAIFGIEFVGVFFATFIVIFGISFMTAFIVGFAAIMIMAPHIERQTNSWLERILRLLGLIILIIGHTSLIGLTLLGGWRYLV